MQAGLFLEYLYTVEFGNVDGGKLGKFTNNTVGENYAPWRIDTIH